MRNFTRLFTVVLVLTFVPSPMPAEMMGTNPKPRPCVVMPFLGEAMMALTLLFAGI